MAAKTRTLSELFGKTLDCACGRQHPILTRGLCYGPLEDVAKQDFEGARNILVLCDEMTRKIAGDMACAALKSRELRPKLLVLPGAPELHADEAAVEVAQQAAQGMDMILAVGTGTLGDIGRYASYTLGLPFATLATAASMDGFVSTVSPLLQGGFKRTVVAQAPRFVFADPQMLLSAPREMAAAGVGDMAGKLTAVLDWQLSAITEGEYYCEETAGLVLEAAERAIASAGPYARGEAHAAKDLMDGLVLSGIAMQMMDNSRPASGSEHHVAHFWEMQDLRRGVPARLHGARVGVSTLLMLRLYQLFFARLPEPKAEPAVDAAQGEAVFGELWPEVRREQEGAQYAPFAEEHRRLMEKLPEVKGRVDRAANRAQEIREAIALLGGPVRPEDLGYTKEDVRLALLWGCQIRQRMTLLRLLRRWGVLEELVEELLSE